MKVSKMKMFGAALAAMSLGSAAALTETVPQFGAVNSYLKTADKPTEEQNVTLAAWFKVTGEPTNGHDYDTIIGTSGRNSDRGLAALYYNNALKPADLGVGMFGFPTQANTYYVEVPYKQSLADDAWHLGVVTVSGATYTLYLDGEPVGTKEGTDERTAGASYFNGVVVGADAGKGGRNFLGQVTEASFWATTLSADQIKALYTNKTRLSGKETGLWLYWPLNDAATDEGARDASGNNHNGKYTGTVPREEVETPFTGVGEPVTVSFQSAEGEKYGDVVTVIPNTACAVVPEDPFKVGYVFKGWSDDAGETVRSPAEVAEVVLTASTTWVAQFDMDERPVYNLPKVAETATFTATEQKPEIAESEGYTVTWTGDWMHVGEHTVTLTLTNPEGSFWNDGTTEAKTFACTITQATNAWTVEPALAATQWETGTAPEVTPGTPAFGATAVMTPADLAALPVGAATVTFTVAACDDYTGLEKSFEVFVVPQGLDPTGDPDTASTDYTWKADVAESVWYNPANWTAEAESCYGYPANDYAFAFFKAACCTVSGKPVETTLGGLRIDNSDVTLSGGNYTVVGDPTRSKEKAIMLSGPSSLTLTDGATLVTTDLTTQSIILSAGSTLRVLNGATFKPAKGQSVMAANIADLTMAVTNATIESGFNVRNVKNFTGTFHNATINGSVEFAGGAGSDLNQKVVFSGTDSDLTFTAGSSFANQGLDVVFEKGVNLVLNAGPNGGQIGKNSTVTLCGDNVVTVGCYFYPSQPGATLVLGAGTTVTLNDFGMCRNVSGASDCRMIVSNATVTANNQVYMPQLNMANKENCGVTFMGDRPRVTVGNTDVYIGKETPADGEVLPSWRYVLPAAPYEVAPMVINAAANRVAFVWNTPIELDLTGAADGRYALFTFGLADLNPSEEDLALLNASASAWTLGADGSQKDAKTCVTLGWDAETKTIYADLEGVPAPEAKGFILLLR